MNLGVENRKQLIALGALAAVALLLVLRALFSSSAPEPTAVTPVAQIAPAAGVPAHTTRTGPHRKTTNRMAIAPHSIDPMLRFDWLKTSEDVKYEGNGKNIFIAQADIPTPVAPGHTDADKVAEGPPTPPPPPPINLKFYGFASQAGEPKRIFLSQGEDVFIASEGQVIDRRYKVVRISPMSVEIEDMLNNNRQSIPLTQG